MGLEGHHQDAQHLHCGRPGGGKQGEGIERLFEEIESKTSPNLMKDMSINTQEPPQTPSK